MGRPSMISVQALVAEIGSTITTVSAFQDLDGDDPQFLGQGYAPTSVEGGDVRIGLQAALDHLASNLGGQPQAQTFLASSSAAGGLRMSVHGLVRDMTVRAAQEAALGAGANISMVTAGKMRPGDLQKLHEISPNILLLAGGVDYGERETILHNAQLLANQGPRCPVVYAGNIQALEEARQLFEHQGIPFHPVSNVYPAIDQLEVNEARRAIQNVFEQNITHAPGMEHIRQMVDGRVVPTPGAVLDAAELLQSHFGDVVVMDVGGATTDVHAVCEDSEEFGRLLIAPEPFARRTVEGDLGTYVSRHSLLKSAGEGWIRRTAKELNLTEREFHQAVESLPPLPSNVQHANLAGLLAQEAARQALSRHAGQVRTLYGPGGKTRVAEGKDLSSVQYLVATGGALTRLPEKAKRLHHVLQSQPPQSLTPALETALLFDQHYIMAVAGTLSKRWPKAAVILMKRSFFPEENP